MSVRAYKKCAYPSWALFYSYTTQFPFRGHNQWLIADTCGDKAQVIQTMKNFDFENDFLQA